MTEVCSKVAYGVSEGVRPDIAPPSHLMLCCLVRERSVERALQGHCLIESIKYRILRRYRCPKFRYDHPPSPVFSTVKGLKEIN